MKPIVVRTGHPRESLAMQKASSVCGGRAALAVVLALSLAPGPASADWPALGRPISTAPRSQTRPAIATDGADGAIITWQDARSPRLNVFAQHVRASGELDAAWPVDGRALLGDSLAIASADGGQSFPLIVADGAGGAIVAWRDLRSGVTEFDIYAQHVLASGELDPAWPANGTALCEIAGRQSNHAIVSDGAGGAIVTWTDARPGASVADVYAQHVLASGLVDPRWPRDGLAVCAAPGLQEFPALVEDGTGGAIICWEDGRSATTGFDIYAQHVLGSGAVDPGWPVDGRALCAAEGDQGRVTITTDGGAPDRVGSGAIVAWSDSRLVGTSHIFAHHVLASGTVDPAWPADGRAVSGADVIEGLPHAVPDGVGGAIINWQGFTAELNMYVHHVTAGGVLDPAWPAAGRALSDADRQQTNAAIVPDGAGGALVAWQDGTDVVAQHVLASGALDPAYPARGRAVSNLPSGEGTPALTATVGAGAIVTWTDSRGVDPDIFALQVLVAGTVDVPGPVPPGLSLAPPRPNPASGSVTLRYALPRTAAVSLAIFDVTGRRVRELVSRAEPGGEHAIEWDLRDERGGAVGLGIYFARLEVERRTLIQKLARVR